MLRRQSHHKKSIKNLCAFQAVIKVVQNTNGLGKYIAEVQGVTSEADM